MQNNSPQDHCSSSAIKNPFDGGTCGRFHKPICFSSLKVIGKIWRLYLYVATLLLVLPATASAGQITQYFPVSQSDRTAVVKQSGWRIKWQVLESGSHNYGGSAIWQFDSIEFMKGKLADGTEDWIKILNNLAMAEMYVPYNDGETAFFDIQGFSFGLIKIKPSYITRIGVIGARQEDDYVISSVVNEGLRWMDINDDVRHGQALRLWATMKAGNYSYVMKYTFSDDGKISVRVGGTANNFKDLNTEDFAAAVNSGTHVHMGAWRMEFDLGNTEANRVDVVERLVDPASGTGRVAVRPFNGGREGGEVWDHDKFTTLKISNTETFNRHDPPQNVSYVLKTVAAGRLRSQEGVTKFDFWVTRRIPDSPRRFAPELKFVEVPINLQDPEPTDGRGVVVWHNSSLQHIPRGEDFGPTGYVANNGAAPLSYSGFDLLPVNLWHKTPFLTVSGSEGENTNNGGDTEAPQRTEVPEIPATPGNGNTEQPKPADKVKPDTNDIIQDLIGD